MDFRQARILGLVSVFLMATAAFFLVSAVNQKSWAISRIKSEKPVASDPIEPEIETAVNYRLASVDLPLGVPEYFQKYKASCETAATRAVMLYFKVAFSEDDILEEIGWDNPPRYYNQAGDLVWGNPQSRFVGNPDPKKIYVDGYGVYNRPIYRFLAEHGFGKSVSKTDWNMQELLSYVKRGYPALVWVAGDFKKRTSGIMIDSEGAENPWIFAEHAVVIRGFDDSGIDIMDPAPGTGYRRITYKQFEDGFISLGNMAIVVIPGDLAEL
jgi:uncharacterized protein YvpB